VIGIEFEFDIVGLVSAALVVMYLNWVAFVAAALLALGDGERTGTSNV
jgi:hypothetical protein